MDLSHNKITNTNKKLFLVSTSRIKATPPIISKIKVHTARDIKNITPLRTNSPIQRFCDSPSFTISRTNRFQMSILEKFKCIFYLDMSSHFKSRKVITENSMIKSNKDMRPFTPEIRREKNKQLFSAREAKHEVIRVTKSTLIKMKKEIVEFKLEEKFKKLFFRQQKTVYLI